MYLQSFHFLAWVIRIITLWFQKSFIFSSSRWSWERQGETRRVNYSVFWRAIGPALCGCFVARVPRVHVGVETPNTGFDWADEWVNSSKKECLTSVVFSAPNVCLTVSKISLVNIWLRAAVRLPFYVLKGSPLRFLLAHRTLADTHTYAPSKTHIYSALSTELSKDFVLFNVWNALRSESHTCICISLFITEMTSHLLQLCFLHCVIAGLLWMTRAV